MNEVKKEIKCPLCNSMMPLRNIKDQTSTFNNVTVTTDQLVYECDECLESFHTTEIAEINLEVIRDKFEEITSS